MFLQTLLEELAEETGVRRGVQETHDMRPAVGSFARPQSAVSGDRISHRRRRADQLEHVAVQRVHRIVRVRVVRQILLGARFIATHVRQRDAGFHPKTNAILTAPPKVGID